MEMIKKLCLTCRVYGWHNPRKKAKDSEQTYRCVYCGDPVTNQKGSPKRDNGEWVRDKQVIRAKLMGLTS